MSISVSKMTVRMRSLTPLWLGDVDRDGANMRESGLLGSLRFWYEGLLRGSGIGACDPLEHKEACTCEACALFGATGRARRFRLELDGLEPVPVFFRASAAVTGSSGNWLWRIFGAEETGGEKRRGASGKQEFTFGVRALWSTKPFTVTVYPRPKERDWVAGVMAVLLQEVSTKGGLGAKTQYGFGQVSVESATSSLPDKTWDQLLAEGREYLKNRPRNAESNQGLFTLDDERFFTRQYEVPEPSIPPMFDIGKAPANWDRSYIPCAFDIRYKYQLRNPRTGQGTDQGLRPAIRERFGNSTARDIFGFVSGDEAEASRVHVSHLYRVPRKQHYRLKVWGDVSRKDEVLEVIEQHVLRRFRNSHPSTEGA